MAKDSPNPDGKTSTTHPDDDRQVTYQPAVTPVDPGMKLPGLYIAQLAIASMLKAVVTYVKDDENVAAGKAADGRKVNMKKIYLDWPPNEAELGPATATVLEADEQDFGDDISAARYLEDTLHKFGDGTILFRSAFSVVRLQVYMTFGHRDDRRAFRAELEDWLVEQQTERMGRAVNVPAYYGVQVRTQLVSLQHVDDGEKAQRDMWPLVAGIVCQVPIVRLVTAPVGLRPRVTVAVE